MKRWAPSVYRQLEGLFCVYKPKGSHIRKVVSQIQANLSEELNSLPCYKHEFDEARRAHFALPYGANNTEKSLMLNTWDKEEEDLTEHRLVLGNRYIDDDFKINFLHGLGVQSSGVQLLGLGPEGKYLLKMLARSKFLRVYHVKGKLGYATTNSLGDGTFVMRTSYKHITKPVMDKFCSSAQSGHQKLMFEYAGIDPDTEEAYKLASGGTIRPLSTKTPPILYSVKCIHFEPPDFTLEIHAINEHSYYLSDFIHDLGIRLKSTAVCTHIHRLRYGHFELEHTLLKKDWTVRGIRGNMRAIDHLLAPNKMLTNLPMRRIGHNLDDNERFEGNGIDETEKVIRKAIDLDLSDKT